MKTPVTISYQELRPRTHLELQVRRAMADLDRHFGRSTRCRVLLEAPSAPADPGAWFRVRVELDVHGQGFVVERTAGNTDSVLADHAAVSEVFRVLHRHMHDRGFRPRLGARTPTFVPEMVPGVAT